jgi:hypothetical protein
MQSIYGILHSIKWIKFHGHLEYFQKPPLGGRPNTKPRDHGTPNITISHEYSHTQFEYENIM